jgi:hypothetical protein
MDKILVLLGADKLNEDTQQQLKDKLSAIIEIEAKKLLESRLDDEKTKLVEEYENKFETYKGEITGKFSSFVDTVLEDELTIPDTIQEFAKKGQLYNDLIEQFKVRIGVDQGLLDEEVKDLLKEAKDEILNLRKSADKGIAKELELKEDAQNMAAELYLYKKCEGLTESQRKQVFDILGGVIDISEIDNKFQIIADSERFDPVPNKDPEADKASKKSKVKGDPKKGEDQVQESDDDDDEDDDDEDDDKKKKKGKGKVEVDDADESTKLTEDNSPFAAFKKQYLRVLQENKV